MGVSLTPLDPILMREQNRWGQSIFLKNCPILDTTETESRCNNSQTDWIQTKYWYGYHFDQKKTLTPIRELCTKNSKTGNIKGVVTPFGFPCTIFYYIGSYEIKILKFGRTIKGEPFSGWLFPEKYSRIYFVFFNGY